MSNNTNYCGSSKTMGQGDVAVCGRVWWASVYQCDKCKLKDAEAIIAKQAEQIKMLREAVILARPYLFINSVEDSKAEAALESTKEKV